MKLVVNSPKKALKAFLKQKSLRSDMDVFKTNLIILLDKISVIEKRPKDETEEHLKNDVRDFLRDTYYKESNAINTKDKKDLVIHIDKSTSSDVAIIIEAKRPTNKNEMISAANANKKALHELILYYLNERAEGNFQLKQLVITNIFEWYIFDANVFDKYIYQNKQIEKLYKTYLNDSKNNPFFYQEIEKIIANMQVEIPCVYFDIRNYNTILRNNKKEDDRELSALLKILSPQHLLKIASPNDSNSLNIGFYRELLHILGLEEVKEGGKNIIQRKAENRNPASVLEMALSKLKTKGIRKIRELYDFGANEDEQYFSVALELCITWINRILFLKLLEGQLKIYHNANKAYLFLNKEFISDFSELFKLFHNVLAVNVPIRDKEIAQKYQFVPYLNSSLFDITELEDLTISIDSLDNTDKLALSKTSILKGNHNHVYELPCLDYLFRFLDAYDFASEGTEDVQEENKTLITASVLGKVFEKINGYKDGSIFTPAFITMYMCRESIRLAVVEKFNCLTQDLADLKINRIDKYKNLADIYEAVGKDFDRKQANEIINSLKICDPAVGSGHFLVSALNEIIAIKSELGVLCDENGKTLRGFAIEVIDDELQVLDENDTPYTYNPLNKESTRVQKTLFHEKQTIIENCLFGVDINPNSVKICRLRLWIELLKNAYYQTDIDHDYYGGQQLQTLPNIDINIKCGNSLLSRFTLDADLTKALKSIKYDINTYRGFVQSYKNEKNRDTKRGLQILIDGIKTNFKTEIAKHSDPRILKLQKLGAELFLRANDDLFNKGADKKSGNGDGNGVEREKIKILEDEVSKLSKELEDEKNSIVYKKAFEWRFEFPEVLSDEGEFLGFDIIVGNPPYFSLNGLDIYQKALPSRMQSFSKSMDIYCAFIELAKYIGTKNGFVHFIISNKWLTASYGKNTRKFLASHTSNITIIDFDKYQVFPNATVDSCMLSFSNSYGKVTNFIQFDVKNKDVPLEKFLNSTYINKKTKIIDLENIWKLSGFAFEEIKTKIELKGVKLRDWEVNFYRGITTGYNAAFIIDTQTKEKLIKEDKNNATIIKPLLRGRDISKYSYENQGLWLINTHNGIKKDNIIPIDVEKDYPTIFKYLMQFQQALMQRLDKGDTWSNLRNCAYLNDFEKEKLIFTKASKVQAFAYDGNKSFVLNTSYILTGKDLKCLLAILNSSLIQFAFKHFYQSGGIEGEMTIQAVEEIPIPQISEKAQKPFIALVDKIISFKAQNKSTAALETEIDALVYQLYELSEEEIKSIENELCAI